MVYVVATFGRFADDGKDTYICGILDGIIRFLLVDINHKVDLCVDVFLVKILFVFLPQIGDFEKFLPTSYRLQTHQSHALHLTGGTFDVSGHFL